MDVRETFIKLTQYLVSYGKEYILKPFLPSGIQKDEVGNYFIIIGETKTMFTCHLDNYTNKFKKVTHVFFEDKDGKKVKTDGKTPLGADDKAGMTVMLNMIENNVPGCYYFFVGEEPTMWAGGCKGSKEILKKKPEWFERFDRCIAFDRRGYSSIISSQSGRRCCSKEFVDALSAEFKANGMEFKDDPTGRYTDSGVFMDTISEVTNLSCGGFNEHTDNEFLNLDFLETLSNIAPKINWEKLPKVRDPKKREYTYTWKDEKKDSPKSGKTEILYGGYTPPDLKRRNDKRSAGLFGFGSFVKVRGMELYGIIKDYMDYYGYTLVRKDIPFKTTADKTPIYINAEFRKPNNPPLFITIRNNIIHIKHDRKEKYEYIGDLKAFEHVFDIGFAAKFYKYVDPFIQDLLDYKKKIYRDTYWKVTDDVWKMRKDNVTVRITEETVNRILKQYGDFKFKDLIKDYDDLFDEDDFVIKTHNLLSGKFTEIYI